MLFSLVYASVAAAQYDIKWYNTNGCCGYNLGCRNYPAYRCCEEPPSLSTFPYAKVLSSGPPGILVWHELSTIGGCAEVTSTGSINQCYQNAPFEPITVTPIPGAKRRRSISADGNGTLIDNDFGHTNMTATATEKNKEPLPPGSKPEDFEAQGCGKINSVELNGMHYIIEEGVLNEAFVEDLHKMDHNDLIQKYKLELHSGQHEKREAAVNTGPGCGL